MYAVIGGGGQFCLLTVFLDGKAERMTRHRPLSTGSDNRLTALAGVASLLVAVHPATAQTMVPNTRPETPSAKPAPAPATAPVAPPATQVPVRQAPASFDIAAFDVTGVTMLDAMSVQNIIMPFAGPGRTTADVEAARAALENAYKAKGFETAFVEIPPQPNDEFVAGIVLLKVTEARVGEVRVTGSKYHALTVVEKQVPALKPGTVPNFTDASAQFAEANRFPDREVTPSIKAGIVPGTIDIDLKVNDTLPFHAGLELNNDHNGATEPLRVAVSARYTNLWQLGHTISGTYLIAPQDPDQLQVISGSYLAPILGSRWSVLAYGFASNSNVAALGGTQVLGNGYAVGLRGIYRIPGDREQSVTFGFDYKDFKEDIAIPNADPSLDPTFIQTPIAYLPLVISYSTQFGGGSGVGNFTIGMTAGLRGFGSQEADVQVRRFDAIGNFVHVNIEADYNRSFGGDWNGYARFVAQIADSPLVTNEQFSVGGLTSVRGYFQSEAVGDNGVNGTLEARTPSFAGNIGGFVDELRLFVFTDAGYISVLSPLPDQQTSFTLVSVGGGARFQIARYLTGNLAYGVALTDGTDTLVGEGQLVFSVKAEF